MDSRTLLSRAGVFLQQQFLPHDLCERLADELSRGPGVEAAEVYSGGVLRIDRDVRRTEEVALPASLCAEVQERLDDLLPALSRHFQVPLQRSEGVAFLVYRRGGFYRPHRDRASAPPNRGGNDTYRRRVSAVIFVNAPPAYSGGELTLYGLIDDERARHVGLPVAGEPGMLAAFDANLLHEVTPVLEGRRLTAVDWFY